MVTLHRPVGGVCACGDPLPCEVTRRAEHLAERADLPDEPWWWAWAGGAIGLAWVALMFVALPVALGLTVIGIPALAFVVCRAR